MSTRTHSRHPRVAVALACGVAALSVAAVHAYVTYGAKWSNHQVVYYVNPANLDVPEGDAEAAIRAGADAWALQSNADFSFVYGGRTSGSTATYNSKNEVFFRNESNGGTIAVTYYWHDGAGHLLDADILFYDGGMTFFTGASGCVNGIYIEDPAAHEFGHALGLAHSSVSDATMAPSMSYCSTNWRSLASDDVSGVEALYPPAGGSTAPPATPSNLGAAKNNTAPSSALDLAWADNSTDEDAFLVERSLDGTTFMQVAQVGANATRYTDNGLSASTSYTYRVRASNKAGFSAYTNLAAAATAAPTAPAAPTSPSPANSTTNVNVDADLAWACSGAQAYDVYIDSVNATTPYASNLSSPSLAMPRFTAGVTYYWKVVAKNPTGATSSQVWKFTTKTARTKKR